MNKKGFTLVELMVVVAIIPVLAGIAIPMYNADVNRRSLQEAVDTLGAIRDGVCSYAAENGVPPLNLTEEQILATLGVQVPQSLGPAGGRKWFYATIDGTNGGTQVGDYSVRALGGAAGNIGPTLEGVLVLCIGTWDPVNSVFTQWRWECPNNATVAGWLPD